MVLNCGFQYPILSLCDLLPILIYFLRGMKSMITQIILFNLGNCDKVDCIRFLQSKIVAHVSYGPCVFGKLITKLKLVIYSYFHGFMKHLKRPPRKDCNSLFQLLISKLYHYPWKDKSYPKYCTAQYEYPTFI